MDLSKTFPRSPGAKFAGLVMLARTTDKARGHNAGTTGPYHYGCGMDAHVLGFIGSDAASFAKLVAEHADDAAIEAWANERVAGKTAAEIETFNREFAHDGPAPGSDSEKFFLAERERLGRQDVASWFEVLDLDEGRPVPERVAA